MRKIITIVGARPQFIKAAAISRTIRSDYPEAFEEVIVHTGQHYDENMSGIFFEELEIPVPRYNLEVGSGTHGTQTGIMLQRIEKVLIEEKPDVVIVYGDTNTTLAGSLAAAKLHIPVAHIEAGLRSFNRKMPEEVNRITADLVSSFLYCPTETAVDNLVKEGFRKDSGPPYSIDLPRVLNCGDVMYDNALYYGRKAENRSDILERLGLSPDHFVLCTVHRDSNTDNADRLNSILRSFNTLSRTYDIPFLLPLHPRAKKMIHAHLDPSLREVLLSNSLIRLIDPVSYLEMMLLEKTTRMIITDSGGVQKESYFYRKPCLVLRSESEWTELIAHGTAVLADADEGIIQQQFRTFLQSPPAEFPPIFGQGNSARLICEDMNTWI